MKFIVSSDTGSGLKEQYLVAESMLELTKREPINSILLLGDNIYEDGVSSLEDHQFETKFERPYERINKTFHMCLGNHDYGNSYFTVGKGRENYQVQYSQLSKKWSMPAKYYSFKRGPCEFFFLDTNFEFMSESIIMRQYHEMVKKIKNGKSKWNIVCGHHTWRCVGGHGNAERRHEIFMDDLLKEGARIDLYMCGHDHCKNIILKNHPFKKNKMINLLVIGTGGKKYHSGENGRPELYNMKQGDSDLLFHSPNLGACLMKITNKTIKLSCYNEELNEEYTHIIQK
jgi:tartrate-resistant acid phosphatase type 5